MSQMPRKKAPAPSPDKTPKKRGLTITLPEEISSGLKQWATATGHTLTEALTVFGETVLQDALSRTSAELERRNQARIEALKGGVLPGMVRGEAELSGGAE